MATRAFLRDVIGWPFVEDDGSEPGWLIFRTGPSEMGVHPTHAVWEGETYDSPRHHAISLMCDDIEATRADLEAKGATFSGPVSDEGYGLVTTLDVPGRRSDPAVPAEAHDRTRVVGQAPRSDHLATEHVIETDPVEVAISREGSSHGCGDEAHAHQSVCRMR